MNRVIGPSSADELMGHLSVVAREVRLSGTPEEARAFDYIGEQLRGWGYQVNRYEHDALTGYPGPASLTMVSPRQAAFPANGYSLSPATATKGIEGDLVDGGSGSPDDLAKVDVNGRIVMTNGMATPAKVLDAARAGAIGQIHANGDRIYEMCISPVWGTPTPETDKLLPSIPSLGVTGDVARALREALAEGPVRVNLSTQPYRDWSRLPLLTADLPGTEGDDYILFSGHVDSWHLGVMDNGSANATQLEVARLLADRRSELKRGIRIAFWSGHSHARYAGSTWYADRFYDDIATHCVCHVNIDSVGAKGATVLDEAPTMAETHAFTRKVLDETAGADLAYHRISRSSDQSFWGHGVPTVLAALSQQDSTDSGDASGPAQFMAKLGWWWHTPEDTVDKIDPVLLKRDCDIYFATLIELLSAPRLPFEPAAGLLEIASALIGHEQSGDGRIQLADLADRARNLASRVSSEQLSNLDDDTANALIVELLRVIIPVNFTEHGPYDHDLALETEPLPGLAGSRRLTELPPDSGDFRLHLTKLVRERNRISGALRTVDGVLRAAGL